MRLLFILTLLPIITFSQTKEKIIGTWKLDKAYILKKNDFIVYDVEKHPFDSIQLNPDNSFVIKCYQHNTKVYPSKEEQWTIYGQWDYRKNHLYFINRFWSQNEDKLSNTKNKILLIDSSMYIHFGKTKDNKPVYVKFDRL